MVVCFIIFCWILQFCFCYISYILHVLYSIQVAYYFYVHHFEGEGSLSTSGAKVKVYGLIGIDTISIPSGVSVKYGGAYKGFWNVFKIDETGHAHVVNEIVKDIKGAQSPRKF